MNSKIILLCLLGLLISGKLKAYIVYTDINDYTVGYGNTYSSNMDYYDNSDIYIYGDGLTTLQPFVRAYFGKIATKPGSATAVRAFDSGAAINSALNWTTDGTNKYINNAIAPNEFPVNQDRYIGVQINRFGAIHYGWVLVRYTGSTLIIKSYAYESVANVGITTGATSGGPGLGIEEVEQNVLSCYPNPAVDVIHLEKIPEVFDVCDIRILDMNGNEISHEEWIEDEKEYQLNVGTLEPGNYFIYIESQNSVMMEKIIKVE